MRHRIDRRRFAAAVINGDPDLLRRYATSPTFNHGLDAAAGLVETLVAGLLVTADEDDAEHAERIAAAEREPHAPLTAIQWLTQGEHAEMHGIRKGQTDER